MDADKTPEETTDSARPVGTRRAPGPRSSAAPDTEASPARATEAATAAAVSSETTKLETARLERPRSVERHTAELRGPEQAPSEYVGGSEYQGGEYRGLGTEPTVPTNIYRARRPAVAVLLIIPAVGVGLLLLRALAISAFGDTFRIEGVIASTAALASLPLLVAGLYGLVTGAAHGAEQFGFKVWARPPLAYLFVGLTLVVAAGLAIR